MEFSLIAILGLCLTCIPLGCSAFLTSLSRSRPPYWYWTRESSTCVLHQSTTDKNTLQKIHIPDQEHLVKNNGNGGTELWLDLRGTSLTPKAALELWHLQERQNNYQEKIEKAPFMKCLISLNENDRKSELPQSNNENEQTIGVLMVAQKNGGDMEPVFLQQPDSHGRSPSSLSSTTPDKHLFGRILPLQSSSSMPILPDPLPAMEIVSQGQWVILDTNGWKKVEEADRISMALSLVELLSSGAFSSGSGSIPGGNDGGIGLTCLTKNEIVKAAMYIQSITNNNGGGSSGRGRNTRTKTLESGIVIPEHDDDDVEADTTSASGNSRIQRSDKANNFAIIIPCDLELLHTAKLLLDDSSPQWR